MITMPVRNVCEALPAGLELLTRYGEREDSRNGPVMVMPFPILTDTAYPCERVLFSSARNANPFFHLFEAVWMLAGCDDAAPINGFIKGFGSRYGEDDGAIHGAYGHRWREAFGVDQLNFVVDKLRREPTTRQCVIQMWDCTNWSDGVGCSDLDGSWNDRPCNTHIYLRIVHNKLELTICCRSNDAIWGAHGANAVHFSILQEYLAARIGVSVGHMYQLSNNYHAYLSELNKYEDDDLLDNRYMNGIVPRLMFDEPLDIDQDIKKFMICYEQRQFSSLYANSWFNTVLNPAMQAHHEFKSGHKDRAAHHAKQIDALDWRLACTEWLERRNGP